MQQADDLADAAIGSSGQNSTWLDLLSRVYKGDVPAAHRLRKRLNGRFEQPSS
jgi:hypothetical protein